MSFQINGMDVSEYIELQKNRSYNNVFRDGVILIMFIAIPLLIYYLITR